MLVTPPAYGHMTHMLKSLAGGKIILALEGGYNLDSIAVSGLACAKALLNDPIEPLDPIIPNAMCVQTIQDVIEVQSRYWKSLPQTFIDPIEDSAGVRSIVGMNKILDIYRKRCLRERHDMIPMPRIEGDQENAFLDNVYCTRRTYNAKPLYIFVHDFGEFSAKTLAHNNIVRTDKSLLVDPVTDYVRRIIDSGNELIDVVLPYQPTSDEEKVALKDKLSSILSEIWDSYVSATGYTGRRIILLAAGFGCYGMVAFMNERQKEIIKYVSCVTMVPGDDSLPMVTKKLGSWYVENSFVFLTDDHPVWERTQKPNSRNGNLIRSEQSTSKLSVLLHHLQGKIFKDIENRLDNLPAVSGDDSDLDIKKDPEPMETDPAPTLVQNDDLSTNSQNEEIKMTITPPKEELQSNTSPQNRLQPPSPISSPLTPVKVEVARSQPPHPLSSLPGSPHLNGMSTPRPHAQPLVDRSSVVSQQHRSQPYPSPNGRSQNGPVSMTQPGSSRSFAASGSPQLRASNPKPMMELQEMKPRPMVSTQQQYQQQQYIDEQRHIESQRQQQYRQQQPDQDTHPLHHRHQHSRSENHPYSEQATNKKVPRSAGPGEYYPTPSTANGSAAVSPSTMTPPHTYSSNGSPHAPHSSLKSNPQQRSPQHQHYSTGYGPQSNGGYRSGPPPSTSASNQPYESMHYQRGSYSSQGPPPVNNGQHQAPHLSPNYRYSGRSQQHQQQQQQQHHMNSPNRMKRSEIESDPYGSHFAQPQPQSQSQFPQPRQQHPEMDRHVEAERQRWEMEQIRQQKVMQHGDRGYDVHGPPPPIYTQQQQQQQQHRHYQNPQQHSHSHVQHHYEPIQHERQHSTMVKQSHHLQHPH
ncbi:Arb2 domain-domain-containing protein [Lobosporangium transversale]|uniref:histone deacetylase n=1 Tax=Lobosporangium transversale TaxID=64571 RepID=A0A1Y2G5C2_9FUNG|nr:Arb2 domain-domain-containing protein [Lobosporangium transversale]ORY95092.1 Arb2 domain-domain-containing protein [Lobosporangium transversale]|eukprot:XP_021875301.1 Arb2 domain-domain-containing protein [Lobosporangium transversale]